MADVTVSSDEPAVEVTIGWNSDGSPEAVLRIRGSFAITDTFRITD